MEDNKLAVVNRIAEILGKSGREITTEYVRLVIVSAITWFVVFTLLLWFAWSIDTPLPDWKAGYNSDGDEFRFIGGWAVKGAALIAEAIAVGTNLPSLLAPKAEAIEKLISSLPGAD